MNILPILNNTNIGIDYGKVSDIFSYRPGVALVVLKPGQNILDHTHTAAPKTILLGDNGNMVYIVPPNSLKGSKTTHLVSPKSPMYEVCREIVQSEAPSTYAEIDWRDS